MKENDDSASPALGKLKSAREVKGGVAAVDRAFAVLVEIEGSIEPLSLTELSHSTGLYKSTILRLLVSLIRASLVVQRSDYRYELGPMAFRLGRAYEATNQLEAHVQAALDHLVSQGTQSASFHIRYDDTRRLCLLRVNSKHSTLDNVNTGDLLTLQYGAPAKVIETFTPKSCKKPVDTETLIFSSMGERDPSCASISCPVFGSQGIFMGALSLSGPKDRFDAASVSWMTSILLEEGRLLTKALGGEWPG
ncbi:helix-turn-helix domain-containing protein [Salinicola sp. MIT1003]|uniref:IclR family transcriptional regulator n=1 Tax=Salinicola sp. MIT1003 TaxID=1882734 RepID=UPI000A4EEC7B|nr:helix-turn-helix domain-containing protein [Salinicola sp. MIT1003]